MTLSVLIDEATIARRVKEMAAEISRDYADQEELVLVGVLRGAFIFLADLARRLTIPRRVEFVALQSYQGTTSGAVRVLMDLESDIRGKHVLIVEDIVDSGRTVRYLMENLKARGPASVRICTFVRKQRRESADIDVDYLGMEIPDAWVVGYGLDYNDQYRTLPYVAKLEI
ncbi:MAG: hypoxanthine phosphoribosyltransferase [Gammaproteobacteria bacterium]|nr:hypoxanthine phosphoribosyltransferase [Gammaproteobacteria bacterium]